MTLRKPNGLLFMFGEDGNTEQMTLGCGHCQLTVISKWTEKDWGVCYRCMRIICGPCYAKTTCEPWEEYLAQKEAEFETRRSMGLT